LELSGFHVAHDESGFWKGKFVSQKCFKANNKRREALRTLWCKRRAANLANLPAEPNSNSSGNMTKTMRRVVDLQQFSRYLWCQNCAKPIFIKDYVSEEQHGLAFTYKVKCHSCDRLVLVRTDKPSQTKMNAFDINLKLAIGTYPTLQDPFPCMYTFHKFFLCLGLVDSGSGADPLNN